MKPHAKDQKHVFRSIIMAWILSLSFIGLGYGLAVREVWFIGFSNFKVLSVALCLPVASLVLGIGWAARTRHYVQNIDGSAPDKGTPLDITLRYVSNTTEQLVLFSLVCIILLGISPDLGRALLPIMGVWFFIARVMFWVGYQKSPVSRAIGFASTFHPTVALLGICLFILITA